MVSAYAAGVVVGAPLIAVIGAKLPRKTLLIALMVAFTLGNAATVLAPNYELLIASRFSPGCHMARTSVSRRSWLRISRGRVSVLGRCRW